MSGGAGESAGPAGRRPSHAASARAARAVLAALLLAAPSGCSIFHETVGAPLPADLSPLQAGVTTKAEALALLGAPDSVRRQFDGDLYTWFQSDNWSERLLLFPFVPLYSRTRGTARTDSLALLFDERGVLAGVGVQREIPREE